MAVLAAWAFPSSSNSTTYETTLDEEGILSCNCPGFIFKKRGQVRNCKHTRQVTPYVNSVLNNLLTVAEVAERLGITETASLPTVSTQIPPASIAPSPLPPVAEKKARLLDFEE